MSVEMIEGLASILEQPILDQINQVPDGAPDLIFNRLIMDSNSRRGDGADFQLLECLRFPGSDEALADYVRVFYGGGAYERFVGYVERNYPIDESTAGEMALFAIWKSFYIIPWEKEETSIKTVRAYIYNTLRQFARNHMHGFIIRTDRQSLDLLSEKNRLGVPVMPVPRGEDLIIQSEELELMIDGLLVSANVRKDDYFLAKRNLLQLLGLGYGVGDIADEFGLLPQVIRSWIRRFKGSGFIDTDNRIEVEAGGSWCWNDHTANVILSNPYVVDYLTEKERGALMVLREEGSLRRAKVSGRVKIATWGSLLHSIRTKVRSAGVVSRQSAMSYEGQKRCLVLFLQTTRCETLEDREICDALIESGGSQVVAAKALNVEANRITTFLEREGYYRK